jgi:hypothetical protein
MQINNTVCRNVIAADKIVIICFLGFILDFLYFRIDMFYLQALWSF